jgi:phenylpyruvate tautomerase PptA (4-oxalocrotonate tautomerase family)
MPICNIKAPPGISQAAKARMLEKISQAIDEGYDHIGVTIITLEEDALDNVMIAGRMASSDPKYEAYRQAQAADHRDCRP